MKNLPSITRRRFAQGTALAAMASGPAINALGANDRIQLGLIGLGGRGSHHLRQLTADERLEPHCRIVSLADPDRRHLDRNRERLDHPVQVTQDFCRTLDNSDVDAVIISTPDHWHGIQTVLACEAGKDVFIEKPLSLTIEEGLRILEAEKRYKRVIAVGQQQRSEGQFQKAVEMAQNGELGKITSAYCLNVWRITDYLSGGPEGIGFPADTEPPAEVDYDLWLGPAPKRPFNPARFHFNFYFLMDYSGGMLTAWGVHLFDIVMWAMGPRIHAATCVGGKFAHDDMRDTPDTAEVVFETPGYTFSYTLRHGNGFPGDPEESGIDHGVYFYGTEAALRVNRRHACVFPEENHRDFTVIPQSGGDIPHKLDFLERVRDRRDPICAAQDGFDANLPGLLALISWQLGGRRVEWDPDRKTITGDREARRLMSRDYRRPWTLPRV